MIVEIKIVKVEEFHMIVHHLLDKNLLIWLKNFLHQGIMQVIQNILYHMLVKYMIWVKKRVLIQN